MNFQNILNAIQSEDPEVFEKLSPRRHILKSFGSKVAVAALPFAIGSLFNKAYGKSTGLILDTLSFALTLEYLEDAFYKKALAKPFVFPTETNINSFKKISAHESAHVEFLKAAIAGLGSPVPAAPNIDLTGGLGSGNGPFKPFFDNYQNILVMAQSFEDLGVRAYKNEAPNLLGYPDLMKAALGIHSMEARHAAQIRMMRFEAGGTDIKPWITGNNSYIQVPYFENVYAREENVTQAGISVVNLNGENISVAAATEAFDEPLSQAEVLKIVENFIY
jgi:hypothetical protein